MTKPLVISNVTLVCMLLYCINILASPKKTIKSSARPLSSTYRDSSVDFKVTFSNQSDFSNPGFVRCPFLFGFDEFNIFIHSDKQIPFKTVICNESTEMFYSGDTHIPYILRRQDTVYIKNSEQDSYRLYSRNSIRNNEINFFQEAVDNKIPLLYWETGNQIKGLIDAKSVSNNLSALQKIYKKTQEFTDNYIRSHIVSDDFKKFIADYIRFDHYVKVFNYVHNESIIDSIVKSHYFDFHCDENNIFHNCNYAFQSALYQYARFILKSNITENNISRLFVISNENFSQHNASIIKFLALKNCMKEVYLKSKPALLELVDKIGNDEYSTVIQNKIDNYEFSINNQNSIIDIDGNKASLSKIISRSKGKVILIDFWASWCQPCRREFSYYPTLITQLDTSKIAFIFISIDRSRASWISASRFERLAPNANYLLVNATPDVLKELNLLSIPRYYLIGPDGLIKTKDAPPPSDERLLQSINKLIIK